MTQPEVSDRAQAGIPPFASPVEGQRSMREAEALPMYAVEDVDLNYTAMLQKFRERALFVDGVRKEALSHTKPHHWLSRKGKGGQVTFSLMGPGAERIRTIAPIGFVSVRRREERWNKEEGPGYTIYFDAEVYLGSARTGLLPVMGTCSSDDDFFSTEHSELPYNAENPEHKAALDSGEGRTSSDSKTIYIRRRIPATEVTKENIEKSALTNLIVNGVTRVLGIRNVSAEELAEAGIPIDKIGGFEYGSGRAASGALAPADEQKRAEMRQWLVEMNGGDEGKALAALKKLTAFNDYPGCEGWERLTVKQIARKHPELKAAYDVFREGAAPDGKDKQQQAQKGPQRATGKQPAQPEPGSSPGGQKPLL